MTGLFISVFIGERIIISGLKNKKKPQIKPRVKLIRKKMRLEV
jgi:hypothetical protein